MAILKYNPTNNIYSSLGKGFAQLLDISDLFDLFNVEAKFILDDKAAMRSDWIHVGNDIQFGISSLEKEYPELTHGRKPRTRSSAG